MHPYVCCAKLLHLIQTLISSNNNDHTESKPNYGTPVARRQARVTVRGDGMTTTQRDAANSHAGARQDRTEADPLTVRALARGLSILGLYDVDHREWTIDEIAARTGLLRMTAYRMVRTLEAAQFLVRDTATNRYHLGPAAITMAYVAEDNSEFVEHARPYLEELLETTGESVTLAVPVDGSPVCVSIIDSSRPFQREIAPGRIIGDLASVHGKIFTAFATPERRAAVLAALPLLQDHGGLALADAGDAEGDRGSAESCG